MVSACRRPPPKRTLQNVQQLLPYWQFSEPYSSASDRVLIATSPRQCFTKYATSLSEIE
eukprot:TRINITY_DN6747_c0_g1_i1.p1 TRINITY_DN6747_c0_g1~~TRINITY_DN6747_c0_g1_i1.p1  ORF type:complete len:59 (-),score=10.23 TRINITY_DN6747_c0_g1_i1:80-256(-)